MSTSNLLEPFISIKLVFNFFKDAPRPMNDNDELFISSLINSWFIVSVFQLSTSPQDNFLRMKTNYQNCNSLAELLKAKRFNFLCHAFDFSSSPSSCLWRFLSSREAS
jgi:hypothetical protein